MRTFDWGGFFRSLQKAADDLKANKPLPTPQEVTGAQLASAARQLQSVLPSVITWLDQNPGAVRAADDILEALKAGGLTWAATAENAVNGAPSAFVKAEDWLPDLIGLLEAFTPAPTGIRGGITGARGHI